MKNKNNFFFYLIRCHGQKDNVVYELAKDHDLFAANPDELKVDLLPMFKSDGTKAPMELVKRMMELALGITEDRTAMELYNGSLGSFFNEK